MSRRYRYYTSLAIRSLAIQSLARCSVLVLLLYALSLVCESPVFAQTVVDGGLTAPEVGWTLSSNLLVNGDFSQGTTGWTLPSTCFGIDPTTLAPNGGGQSRVSIPLTCSHNPPIAINSFKPGGGAIYTLSGQVMTEDFVGTTSYAGAMFDLFGYDRSPTC